MMNTYRVCVWETVGGYVDFVAENESDVVSKVEELINMEGSDSLCDVTYREVDTCGVDLLK